jgi:hypothetical protein
MRRAGNLLASRRWQLHEEIPDAFLWTRRAYLPGMLRFFTHCHVDGRQKDQSEFCSPGVGLVVPCPSPSGFRFFPGGGSVVFGSEAILWSSW